MVPPKPLDLTLPAWIKHWEPVWPENWLGWGHSTGLREGLEGTPWPAAELLGV